MSWNAFAFKIQRELCHPKSFGTFEKRAPASYENVVYLNSNFFSSCLPFFWLSFSVSISDSSLVCAWPTATDIRGTHVLIQGLFCNQLLLLTIGPTSFRAVFKWLSKHQNQSNYSDQSQQEQAARWTNHNSEQLSVTCSKRGKNHAYMARLVLVLILIGWITGASLAPITKRSNRNHVITFDSHLKTVLLIPLNFLLVLVK